MRRQAGGKAAAERDGMGLFSCLVVVAMRGACTTGQAIPRPTGLACPTPRQICLSDLSENLFLQTTKRETATNIALAGGKPPPQPHLPTVLTTALGATIKEAL